MEEMVASELGTYEYWKKQYEEEMENFKHHGDPGEIWFGEDIVDRVISWMNKCENVNKDSKILDVGCGNGMFLVELHRENYTNLHGTDYCQSAIDLAQSIAKKQNMCINYFTCNILEGLGDTYDVIHDKGTYDAISLSPNAKDDCCFYVEAVHKGMKDDGLLIITSCNWTHDELSDRFSEYFQQVSVIPTPQFKFGGKVGNVVSSVVYKKIIK